MELPDELGPDGIFERDHLPSCIDDGLVVRQRGWRPYQDEAANAVLIVECHPLRDHATRRVTHEGRLLGPDLIHERGDVGCEVIYRVAALRLIRVPVPALIERKGMVFWREQRQHPAEGAPRVGVRVEEDDRFPLSIASFGVVKRHARRELRLGALYIVQLVRRIPPLRPAFPGGSYAPRMMPPEEARCMRRSVTRPAGCSGRLGASVTRRSTGDSEDVQCT